MTPQEEAEVLRRAADAVLTEGWGGRAWRLCTAAWLDARAARIAPKAKTTKRTPNEGAA